MTSCSCKTSLVSSISVKIKNDLLPVIFAFGLFSFANCQMVAIFDIFRYLVISLPFWLFCLIVTTFTMCPKMANFELLELSFLLYWLLLISARGYAKRRNELLKGLRKSAPDQAGRERNIGPYIMRHIPFLYQLCSHPIIKPISIHVQSCSCCFFHVVFSLCLGTLYISNLRMRSLRTTYSKIQRHFQFIYFPHVVRIGTRYN